MENIRPTNYFTIVTRDWRKVIVAVLVVVLLTLVLTLLQPFLYRATVSVFVVQRSSFSIDAYSASKSEERIANKLAQIIYSSSFLEKVLGAGFSVDEKYFSNDEYKRRRQWGKMIETVVPTGISKLTIKTYHRDPNQALQIAQAVAYLLTTEKKEFIGIEDIDLKVLDSPLVSKYPIKPNVILNLLLSIIIGVLLGIVFVVITYDPHRDKFFGAPIKQPHLIEYSQVPEDNGGQNRRGLDVVPEITELEKIKELAEAEDSANKPEEKEEDIVEQTKTDDDYLKPPKIPGLEEEDDDNKLPRFSEEDEIFGMPKTDSKG